MTDAFQNNPPPDAGALPQMVQRFFRQFGGGQAPAPPPNLEQGDERPEQRPPGPPPRAFNWANNVLPPGSRMPPPPRFQAFMPASLDRPSEQWGSEEQFPNLPQSFEAGPLAQGLSRWFGQNGSAPIQQMAMAMGPHAGEFLQGVIRGQQQRMVQAREQLALHITEMKERQEEEMTRYAEVMSAHGALNETTDPAKMLKPVKGKSLMEDLYDTAREIGDIGRPGTLGDLIASGAKPSAIVSFLQSRDNRLRDLQKLKSTVDQDTAEDAAWGLTPKQAPAQSDVASYSGLREPGSTAVAEAPATPSVDPVTGQPAPAPAPAPKDKVAGPGAPSDTTSGEAPPETPLDAMVTDTVRGSAPDGTFAKNYPKQYHEIMLRAAREKAAIGNLVANPPKDRSQILPMIRRINPQVANDVEQVANYKVPASGGTSGTGASLGSKASQYGDSIRNLVTLIDPNFNQGFYQDQQRFRTDASNKMVILRTKDLAPVAERLNDDLRIIEADLKKRGMNASDVNLDGLMRMFANDPRYVGLHSDFVAYNEAYNTIVTAGHNTITGVKLQSEGISPYAPLATYRNVIKGHMYGVSGMISGLQDLWESYGGKRDDMPGGNTPTAQADFQIIHDFRDMDYVTGARPGRDIVVHNGVRAHWTGKNQIDRNAQENWEPVD